MNRIKSIFVSVFITLVAVMMVLSLLRLFQNGFTLVWVGMLLTTLPIIGYFANLFRNTTPRTTRNLTPIAAMMGVGVFGTLQSANENIWVVAIALLIFLLWIVYVIWYSKLERPLNSHLAAGRQLSSFTMKDGDGTAVSLSSFAGKKVMLLFYRGNWCPFCMAQIKEVVAQYQEIAQRGVHVVLISPQSQGKTKQLAQKFDVPMTFLVDEENRVARQLGIAHENGLPAGMEVLGYDSDTVLPTLILIDENGRILATNQTDNYRIRPEPVEFLHFLDNLT